MVVTPCSSRPAIAVTTPHRPALRYYGGKWRLAPWIISHFPPHLNYVEPCGGAASVLLRKPRSALETYNDLDGAVVNFFRMLRDRTDELIRKIRLTPWAQAEYKLSQEPCEDQLEQARRFAVQSWMSYNGTTGDNPRRFGWRHTPDARSRRPASYDLVNNDLQAIATRLLGVQITCADYMTVTEHYDNDQALIYLDPPYVEQKRTNTNWYRYDWNTQDHIAAATFLRNRQGYVVLSGYACDLYTDLYETHGWHRFDKQARANSGSKRTESLWLSPRTVEALQTPQHTTPFEVPT